MIGSLHMRNEYKMFCASVGLLHFRTDGISVVLQLCALAQFLSLSPEIMLQPQTHSMCDSLSKVESIPIRIAFSLEQSQARERSPCSHLL